MQLYNYSYSLSFSSIISINKKPRLQLWILFVNSVYNWRKYIHALETEAVYSYWNRRVHQYVQWYKKQPKNSNEKTCQNLFFDIQNTKRLLYMRIKPLGRREKDWIIHSYMKILQFQDLYVARLLLTYICKYMNGVEDSRWICIYQHINLWLMIKISPFCYRLIYSKLEHFYLHQMTKLNSEKWKS